MRAIKAKLSKFSTVDEYVEGWGHYYYLGGILLPTRSTEDPGTKVSIHIQIANGDTVLRAEGVVEEARTNATGKPVGLVIRFAKLDSKSKGLVDRILNNKRASRTSAAHVVPEPKPESGAHKQPELAAIADELDDTFDAIFGGGGDDKPAHQKSPTEVKTSPSLLSEPTDASDGAARLAFPEPTSPAASSARPAPAKPSVGGHTAFGMPAMPDRLTAEDDTVLDPNDVTPVPSFIAEPATDNLEAVDAPLSPSDDTPTDAIATAPAEATSDANEQPLAKLALKSVSKQELQAQREQEAPLPEPPDLQPSDVDMAPPATFEVAEEEPEDDDETLSANFRAVAERAAAERAAGESALEHLLASSDEQAATDKALVESGNKPGIVARFFGWLRGLFGGK